MNVSFTKISDDDTLGSCGNVDITIMESNGYVNASKLGASIDDWLALATSKKLITAIESLSCPSMSAITYFYRGIYINPYLVPYFAASIDPVTAIKISKIINEYFVKRSIQNQNNIILERPKITNSDKLVGQINDYPKMDELLANQNKMMQQNNEIQAKLDRIVRVDVPNPSRQNVFYIVKCNDSPIYNINGSKVRLPEYYAIETKKKMLSMKLNNIKMCHPNMVVIHETVDLPIPSNLWSSIYSQIKKNIDKEGDGFLLSAKYSEKRLLRYIKKFIDANISY
jgi:hypothetical protein